jgi:hypothetical protein
MSGLFIIGNNSFGIAFVAGRNRVPKPATEKQPYELVLSFYFCPYLILFYINIAVYLTPATLCT